MRQLPETVTRNALAKSGRSSSKSPVAVLQEKFGELAQIVARRNGERVADALRAMVEIRGCSDRDKSSALARLDRLPSRGVLEEQREALRAAVYDAASERDARAILGLMLEAIPAAASGATAGYGDALAIALIHADDDRDPDQFPRWRGFSAAVLFATTKRIWEKSTFTPSVAEVLEVARKVRAEYFAALSTTSRLLSLVENAEHVVEDTESFDDPIVGISDPDAIPF